MSQSTKPLNFVPINKCYLKVVHTLHLLEIYGHQIVRIKNEEYCKSGKFRILEAIESLE